DRGLQALVVGGAPDPALTGGVCEQPLRISGAVKAQCNASGLRRRPSADAPCAAREVPRGLAALACVGQRSGKLQLDVAGRFNSVRAAQCRQRLLGAPETSQGLTD